MNATATPADSRRLKRTLAVLGGLVGFGYLYVSRISYAVALVVATYAILIGGAWTRWIVEPAGWYAYVLCVVLIAVVQMGHPVVIAWSRPLAPRKPYNRWWWYVAWVIGVAGLSTIVVPTPADRAERFGYDLFRNGSGSMSPAVQGGDWVVVDGWRYRSRPPQFGEVIVYRLDDGITYVKRLVGLPGDTVEVRGRALVRNGESVDEPYLRGDERGLRIPDFPPTVLGDDAFFVLGDERDNSMDSRQLGPIPRDQIVGRVEFIAFSYSAGRVQWGRFPTMLADD